MVWWMNNIDGLVQDRSNSIANAMELLQSCTKPSIQPDSVLWRWANDNTTELTDMVWLGSNEICTTMTIATRQVSNNVLFLL